MRCGNWQFLCVVSQRQVGEHSILTRWCPMHPETTLSAGVKVHLELPVSENLDSVTEEGRAIKKQFSPTKRPPLEPPLIVSLLGDVYPSLMRYSAACWKSSKQFCLLAKIPPRRHQNNSSRTNRKFHLKGNSNGKKDSFSSPLT